MIFRTLFHHLVIVLPLYWLALEVHAVPVPLAIANQDTHAGDRENYLIVKKGFTEANSYLKLLNGFLQEKHPGHPYGLMIIRKAFGKVNTEQQELIKANIAKLLSTTGVYIKNLRVPATGTRKNFLAFTDPDRAGSTDPEKNPISFTDRFYKLDEIDRAGMIIHEATHALFATFDCFTKSPPHKGIVVDMNKERSHVVCGYEADDLSELTRSYTATTPMNADSYAVAAIYAHKLQAMQLMGGVTPDKAIALLGKPAYHSNVSPYSSPSGSTASASTEDVSVPHTAGHNPQHVLTSPPYNTGHPPIAPTNPLAPNTGSMGAPAQPGRSQGTVPAAPHRQASLPQSGTHSTTGLSGYESWYKELRPGSGPPPPSSLVSSSSAGPGQHVSTDRPVAAAPAPVNQPATASTKKEFKVPTYKDWGT